MANKHLSLVNQKIAYAGTLIAMAAALDSLQSSQRIQQRALEDGALMHLGLAYTFYLRELGENYHLKNVALIQDVVNLVDVLSQAGKSPAEAEELLHLGSDSGSWLAQMLRAVRDLSSSPAPEKPQKAFPQGDNLIAVVDIASSERDSVDSSVSGVLLESWVKEFRQLVLRQRETSAEY
ncbi:DUF6586 family protein [Cellvibrio japonicus]|uniref:PasA protein n=1 Tax=Cellvibrio japonicus (strain Ueda107) TaxID=498211 RepID=B3PHK8_CELJU|nr:DUF6586 family protein [Cellvibrio japonicus]ACE82990.1 conserved hypothetical protein [Cellvibrio japonicus Ueda107]QEI12483.1 hypothetical protein FY117_09785 [Cellvibrio japonicus]QEI16057.1 hypothetical protein FY116_09790 [Cellvibrio japonicus]QEI19635.1 hypothetical protein FY115_09785 [Cellvibrio japonicus]